MITLAPLFRIEAQVAAPQTTPNGPLGDRRFIPVTGGIFTGDRLSGRLLAGGADCQLVRADGVAELDIRVTLQCDDGAIILMKGFGLRHGPPDVMARVAAGDNVDPAEYYFRETMVFEAPPGAYAWLNRVVALGTGERRAGAVIVDVFEVQ